MNNDVLWRADKSQFSRKLHYRSKYAFCVLCTVLDGIQKFT